MFPNLKLSITTIILIVVNSFAFSQNQDINIPESGDFGNVALNAPSVITFTLENNGTGSPSSTLLTISNMSFSGDTAFVVSDITIPPDLLLSKGSSVSFKVTFTPTTTGAKSATLTFTSDDPDENPYILNLSGSGDATLTSLTLLNTYPLTVLEPSGLAYDKVNNQLFTVSDNSNLIYRLSLTGVVQETYGYQGNDLEGVSVYTSNKLLVAEEGNRELVEYDYVIDDGTSIVHAMSTNSPIDGGAANDGIEGVTYDSVNDKFYFLIEKNNGGLYEANGSFSIINEYQDPLAHGGDYSGSYYVEETGFLWLASDQTSTIYKCNTDGSVIESFPVTTSGGAPINKLEGIAIDHANQLLYAVSDAGQELYVFEINDPSLSINDITITKNSIKVFPNPVKDYLNIKLKNYEQLQKVNIYNTLGKLVNTLNTNNQIINIKPLNSGIYFLEVLTNNTKYIKTIIKHQ